MDRKNVVLAAAPDEYERASHHGLTLAHLSYRLSQRGRLLRRNVHQAIRGGMLALSDAGAQDAQFTPAALCADIINEVTARGYKGVVLDFEGPVSQSLYRFVPELAEKLEARRIPLFVSTEYAAAAPRARVLVSSEVTGGSLSSYLEEQAESLGSGRAALEIMPLYMDFLLPSPSGVGARLTRAELQALMKKINPMPFFSRELCAKYFTYMAQDGRAHFVLYDDAYTIMAKMKIAQGAGIDTAFMLYGEVEPFLDDIWSE